MADRITDSSRDRYLSLAKSQLWDLQRIRRAKALVVGAGALGNEVSKNLAMMGLEWIVLVDRDDVEVSNLTRSVFFRESDHGRPKVSILAERLEDLNPDVALLPLSGDLNAVLGLGLVRRMDLVFSCLDNRLARRALNRMCQKVGKSWVDGAMEDLLGDVTVYVPDHGPCYECTLTSVDRLIIAQATSCRGLALQNLALGKVPTVSTMGSIIAALQVQEAMKLFHGQAPEGVGGRRLVVNTQINDFYTVQGDRRDDCYGHFRFGEIREMPAWKARETTALELLQQYSDDSGGDDGHLRLGRDIVVGIKCWHCNTTREFGTPRQLLSLEAARCPECGETREPVTTNVVKGSESYASWPLSRLGVPPLDVLEARGAAGCFWYELTGDLEDLRPASGAE